MMSEETLKYFPCMEQPVRCYFSCTAQDKRLSCTRNGRVISSIKRSPREEFILLPQGSSMIMIQNVKFDSYLRLGGQENDTGTAISTTKEKTDASLWSLQRINGNTFQVTCMDDNTYLTCDQDGNVNTTNEKGPTWLIEFLTGELCYLSAATADKRLRCDLVGILGLTENWKGWEVWRLIEACDGHVRISAWMHHNRYLCSNPEGKVYTTTKRYEDEGTKWAIQRDPKGNDGVVIQSAAYGSHLCFDQESLFMDEEGGAFGVWQLESAHRQKYSLAATSDEKSIGPFPYVTEQKRQVNEWVLEQRGDNTTLFSPTEEKYLGSTANGEVCLTLGGEEEQIELWLMETRPRGERVFRSKVHNRFLTWRISGDKDGILCTVPEEDCNDEREMWRLEPCMPRAVSGGKIKTFAIGTTAAVATTVAMPFAVTGIVGLIGAEFGILADVIAVGLTGAEAIASIGVVGTTAALVFRESGDSFDDSKHEATKDESENSYTKRPFCAWRLW